MIRTGIVKGRTGDPGRHRGEPPPVIGTGIAGAIGSMRAVLLLAALLCPIGVLARTDATPSRDIYENGVVRLQVTYQTWDEDRPWAKNTPKSRSIAAVLVDDKHLLTTADVLEDATFLQLSAFGQPRPGEIEITLVDAGINLALLTVADPSLLEGLDPVPVAASTPAEGVFRTVRWSGQQLESASSRFTRFDVRETWGSRVEHAFIYMRTDIDGGGWSEPVFDDGELVGITVSQAKQVSRAIPAEIIREFLARATEQPYSGFAAVGILWQVNRDPAVIRFLRQEGAPRGVLIRRVPWGSSGCGVLQPRDILLEMNGHRIDAEGFILHERLGRVRFTHLAAENHRPGDVVPVRVLRRGEELELEMTLRGYPMDLDLIPKRRTGQPPFVIAGGLVLRELDAGYLGTWGNDWSKKAPVVLRTRYFLENQGQSSDTRRVVLITSVLPSEYNIGYHALSDEVVEQVNGRLVGAIEDVVQALQHPVDGFHVFELAPGSSRREVILDAPSFAAATHDLLETYRIPAGAAPRNEPLPEGGGSCAGDY